MSTMQEARQDQPTATISLHRYQAAVAVLADRERELLAIKGRCSTHACRLHYAHSGPCDMTKAGDSA